MGFFDSLFGGKKTTTSSTTLDPASQAYLNKQRAMAQGASNTAMAGPAGGGSWFTGPITNEQITGAMNPYLSNVVDATRGEFDLLRGQATTGANQAATMGGAFGGSRHGVMEANRLADLDRSQASAISGLMNQGYQDARGFAEHQRMLQQQQLQDPLFRASQGLGFFNAGMGPTGMNSTTTEKNSGNIFGQLVGAGTTALGIYNTMKNGSDPTKLTTNPTGGSPFAFNGSPYSNSLWR